MKLGAPSERNIPRGNKRRRHRLAAFSRKTLAIKRNRYRIANRSDARRHFFSRVAAERGSWQAEAALDIAIYGGSFNPPHVAHLLAATWALATHPIDELHVVPTFQHPFGKELAPYDDRVRMAELVFGSLPRTRVSRIEESLGGPSMMVRTLEQMRATSPSARLSLIIGSDLVDELPRWHSSERVKELAQLIVVDRGTDPDNNGRFFLPDISSSLIRTLVREKRWREIEPLVPRDVVALIRERGLFA